MTPAQAARLDASAAHGRAALATLRAELAELADPAAAAAAAAAAPASRAPNRAQAKAYARRVEAAGEEGPAPRRKRARSVDGVTMKGSSRLLDWSRDDFARAEAIERGPAAARAALARLPRCLAQRGERAALAMVRRSDGTRRPTRTWAHVEARRIVACLVVCFHAASSSRRRGMTRVLRGRTRRMWTTLFRSRVDRSRPVSVSTLFATSHRKRAHGAPRSPWECGAMVALHRAGALWRHQPPVAVAGGYVGRGKDGSARAFNEYHLSSKACSALVDEAPRAPVDWHHVELVELVELGAERPP